MRRIISISAILCSLCGLSACDATLNRLSNIDKAPSLASVEAPMEKSIYRPIRWPKEPDLVSKSTQHVNSLWQPGNRSFFKDMRARRIGDIVRVIVKISDKAEIDNETARNRQNSNSLGAPNLFGLEELVTGWLPGKASPSALLSTTSTSNNKGTGTIDREEKIDTEVSAMVTQILPNGNLVISGNQEVRVNHELRRVTVEGIIAPSDIGPQNTIDSNMIAEARISYGGEGVVSSLQTPPIGNQILDAVNPF